MERPEPKTPKAEAPASKKSKKEIVSDLAAGGLTVSQISRQTGMPYGTVYHHYRKYNPNKKHEMEGDRGKKNGGRVKCRTCVYRGKKNGCDYIEYTGHRRGCSVENCNKYESSEGAKGKTARTLKTEYW